jgi:hypothetical protein
MADDQHRTYLVTGLPDCDGHVDGQSVDAVLALRLNTHSNSLPLTLLPKRTSNWMILTDRSGRPWTMFSASPAVSTSVAG